ncbi:MAG: helix-turn-helix transcriptional regulator [Firmicutes bacterium]|jgi:CBS domain-containing protein|nr:helix-turn-helix transcriptional regulator [Bacillota bacterium]
MEVAVIDLSERQKEILEIVKALGPISGEEIAARLNVSRAALRPCLAVLTMSGLLAARPRVGYYFTGKEKHNLLADYLERFKVSEIKAVPAVVREETPVSEAIVTLFVEDVGTLFVVSEEGCLQGVVSRKDLLKAAIGTTDLTKIPVTVIMTRMPNIVTIDPEASMLEAARKIVEYQIDALPVVKEHSKGKLKLLGKVTKTTLVRLLAEISS